MRAIRIPWRIKAGVIVDTDLKTFKIHTDQQKRLLKQQAFNQGCETEQCVRKIIRTLNAQFDESSVEGRAAISGWLNRLGPRAGDIIRKERQWHKMEMESSKYLSEHELSWQRYGRDERRLMRDIREGRRKYLANLIAALEDIERGLYTPGVDGKSVQYVED